jgi:hypothetical protein
MRSDALLLYKDVDEKSVSFTQGKLRKAYKHHKESWRSKEHVWHIGICKKVTS